MQFIFAANSKVIRRKDIIVTIQNLTDNDFYIQGLSGDSKTILLASKTAITEYYVRDEIMDLISYYSSEDEKNNRIRIALCVGDASRVVNLK